MKDFNVGDKVKIVKPDSVFYGKEGEIIDDFLITNYIVAIKHNKNIEFVVYNKFNIELVSRPVIIKTEREVKVIFEVSDEYTNRNIANILYSQFGSARDKIRIKSIDGEEYEYPVF